MLGSRCWAARRRRSPTSRIVALGGLAATLAEWCGGGGSSLIGGRWEVAVLLGLWLLVVVCDLLRAATDATSARRRGLLAALGVALLGCAGVAAGFDALAVRDRRRAVGGRPGGLGARLVARAQPGVPAPTRPGAPCVRRLRVPPAHPGRRRRDRARAARPDGRQPGRRPSASTRSCWSAGWGCSQLSTANLLVRLLLDAIGVPAASNEDDLKGGRLLGPMERLVILVLAVAGELTASPWWWPRRACCASPSCALPHRGGPSHGLGVLPDRQLRELAAGAGRLGC